MFKASKMQWLLECVSRRRLTCTLCVDCVEREEKAKVQLRALDLHARERGDERDSQERNRLCPNNTTTFSTGADKLL